MSTKRTGPIDAATLRGWRLAAEAALHGRTSTGERMSFSAQLAAEMVIRLLDEIDRLKAAFVPRPLGDLDRGTALEPDSAPSGCVECTTRAEHVEHVRRLMQAGGGTVQLPPVVDLRPCDHKFVDSNRPVAARTRCIKCGCERNES